MDIKSIRSWKKQFAIIYAGQAFSLVGSAAVQFAIIWWLTIQTESALTLTIAAILGFLPNLLIGPFAGVWIDRYNRRTVMIAADGFIAFSSIVLAVAFILMSDVPVWFIYVILFGRGVGNTFHSPAMQSAIPLLVPQDMLEKAGGWGNLINSFSNMLGPVLGALFMGIMPFAAIMMIDIAGAAFAIICLLFIKIPDVAGDPEKHIFWRDMKAGLRAMKDNRPLMAVFFPMTLCNILFMPLGALFPLLVRTHYNGTALHNSLCEFIFAGGLLCSSLIIGIWGGLKKKFLMVSIAIGILGTTSLISGALPSHGFIIFVVCCFFMGASGTFINVPLMAYTQETIAPEMMGKVFSLMMTAMSLAMPVGLLIAGPVSEIVGINMWFLYSGIGLLLTAFICHISTMKYDATGLQEGNNKY